MEINRQTASAAEPMTGYLPTKAEKVIQSAEPNQIKA